MYIWKVLEVSLETILLKNLNLPPCLNVLLNSCSPPARRSLKGLHLTTTLKFLLLALDFLNPVNKDLDLCLAVTSSKFFTGLSKSEQKIVSKIDCSFSNPLKFNLLSIRVSRMLFLLKYDVALKACAESKMNCLNYIGTSISWAVSQS